LSEIEFLFVLLLAAAGLVRLADLIRVPYPIVLVIGGLVVGLIPGLPDLQLQPEIIFLVFLPPLLASAGFNASPQQLWAERRSLSYLSVGLVLATIAAVAVVAHELVAGLPWAAAFALGGVVAPTDPVAAIATFQRAVVPDRVRLVVEGESMINDASALVAFRVALAALTGGSFDALDAGLDFVLTAAGGIAVGLVAGWIQVRLLERLDDRPLGILLSVLFSYGSYVAAERAHVSGVLAAVLCGLYLGWHQHHTLDADTRLSALAFWEVLVFALNTLIFILLGLQFPGLTKELRDQLPFQDVVVAGLAIAGTVIVLRLLAQFVPFSGTADGWRERVVVGWSGMRGAISLAAALSVPLDADGRAQIVVLTFVVILVTLVGQGLTLPLVVKALRLGGQRLWSPEEAIARLESAQAALDRLDDLQTDVGGEEPEAVKRLRELYRSRFRMCQAVLSGEPGARTHVREARFRYSDLRRELIGVERETLLELRGQNRLRQDVLRQIERDLDLEEARLSAAAA
jgi:CPA1 family monovalent cation:H+ antiporter